MCMSVLFDYTVLHGIFQQALKRKKTAGKWRTVINAALHFLFKLRVTSLFLKLTDSFLDLGNDFGPVNTGISDMFSDSE